MSWYEYCPECGNTGFKTEGDENHRQCDNKDCLQEYFLDIDYRDVYGENLNRMWKEIKDLKEKLERVENRANNEERMRIYYVDRVIELKKQIRELKEKLSMSKEKIDVGGMEEHYIVVDHTDNSGLSVHKPTEKDIKLFKQYGTMECGNTTHVMPYRDFRKLKEKLEKVTKIAENLADYYGSKLNWYSSPSGASWYEYTIHEDDIEDLGDRCMGGKLARQKQKELKEILNKE